jgi:hypothetical protein
MDMAEGLTTVLENDKPQGNGNIRETIEGDRGTKGNKDWRGKKLR